jgi:hypothetical protein
MTPRSVRSRRIAARLRTTAIKNVNANSVLHMSPSPTAAGIMDFYFVTFFGLNIHVAGGIPETGG